ncbi:glutamine synthetase [candidate division WOR-3 bacterium JGI_Cruoil_03_51_56]|uniref:Glutamine synthetase n=1 Tax=candidate division WOR-3 bacterium JGI_Cruoil_03_51_56 TaxID=1973747 RepID=A0A235BPJ4_UNCW3|nr:MAG: glutamine synthetase [candidate division WOR-3 bacterium JGI_Cruoil_03_51_56]
MSDEGKNKITKLVESEKVRFINLLFSDIDGIAKSVTMPAEKLPDLLKSGVWFDGSSVEGFARIAESDMYLKPDLSTFAIIPWEKDENTTARIICNVHGPDSKPFIGDPRYILIQALKEAEQMGFHYITAPECEFFLFKMNGMKPLPNDQAGYFDYSTDEAYEVRKEMVNALHDFGIHVEASHHEVAIGQHEINFKYDNALRTADNTLTFKLTLKTVAMRHGLHATFMPKPVFGINGSGMHTNQSLFSIATGKNAFYNPKKKHGLSKIARHFIAGQLIHARGMSAILSPLVNSYKRLVPGYEAPVYIAWARINRSALIRIPQCSPENTDSARIELRCPDPSCNPYLAFAVMLKCGLEGIKQELEPPPPTDENLYLYDTAKLKEHEIAMLPSSLTEALDELEKDRVVCTALGPHITQRFLEAKRKECKEAQMQVTPWELEKYLPIY